MFKTLSNKDFIHKRGEMFSGAKGITKEGINLEILKIFEELFNNIYDNFIIDVYSPNSFIDIGLDIAEEKYSFYFRNSSNLPIKVLNDNVTYFFDAPLNTEVILPYYLFNKIQTSSKYNDDIDRLTSGLNGYGLKWIVHRFTNYEIIVVYENLIYRQDNPNNFGLFENKTNLPNSFSIYFNLDYSLTKGLEMTVPYCMMRIYEMFICLYLHDVIPKSLKVNNIDNIKINEKSFDVWLLKNNIKKKLFEINSYMKSKSNDKNNAGLINNHFKLIGCIKEPGMKNIIVLNSLRISSSDFLNKIYDVFNERLFKEADNKKSIDSYISFMLIGNFNNLVFDSQSKSRVVSEYELSDDLLKKIKSINIEIFDFIYHNESIKKYKDKKKLLKSKLNNVNYKQAIKQKHEQSTLRLLEGLSALSSVEQASGNDPYFGTLACKGKVINTRKNRYKAFEDDFIVSLSLILDYNIDGTEKKTVFNYNNIHIIADADIDGIHITCLLINVFETFFPKLINNVFIMRFPLIIDLISSKPKRVINEYYEETLNLKNPIYCKGLCSYEKVDMKAFFSVKEKYLYHLVLDDVTYLDKIFGKETEYRKALYNEDDVVKDIWTNNEIKLSDYIRYEYKKFLKSSLKRSIPNIMDGFTESIRKIVYILNSKKTKAEINLANFVSEVSVITNYHHGNVSLESSCKSLGFSTKNIKLINTHGTYGSIKYKHHDCGAARYIRLSKPAILDKLFIPESFNILPYNSDEGKAIEPKFLLPIIPLILINGVSNVSTGYSSSIPGHKFEYMVNYLLRYLDSKIENKIIEIEFPRISYDFFKYESNIREDENKYYSKAEVSKVSQNKFIVLDFPLSYTLETIIETCNKIEDKYNKNIIEDHSDGDNIKIVINSDISKYNFNDSNFVNITVFDDNEKLKEIENTKDLFDQWFIIRYGWMKIEINEIIRELNFKKGLLEKKYNLIKYFIDNHLIKEDDQMTIARKYDCVDIYKSLFQREVTEETIKILLKKITELEKAILYYQTLNIFSYWKILLNNIKSNV